MSNYTVYGNDWNDYLDTVNGKADYCGIELFGQPDAIGVDIDQTHWEYGVISIQFNTELDSDGETDYIYLVPTVTLPTIDCSKLPYSDSFHYYATLLEELGSFIKWLYDNPFRISRDEDYYDEYE